MSSFSPVEILQFSAKLPVEQPFHFFELFNADWVIGRCPVNGVNKIVISYLSENDG
ncbi:hypothetical protein [Peribacillus simplex]|uniref:hypothetical protein n=1 Tax=Peribacillus simplex TaxID=1478 RepID=UPI001C87D51D|nr:hypothetical protein [Peribacillus simplex]